MRRFGTIFPFLEQGEGNLRIGRLVANHQFVKALLKYGSFDHYLFSNPSVTNLRSFEQIVSGWGLPSNRVGRVCCVSYSLLPEILRKTEFQVFHLGGWGYFMPGLHFLRSSFAGRPFPITAVTHSLSGRQSMDYAVQISRAGMAPYDSIFCTSRDARQAMEMLLKGAGTLAGNRFVGQLDCFPLSIDDELLCQVEDGKRVRQQMNIPSGAIVVLTLGRITPCQKMDLAPVLRSFAREILPSCKEDVYLVVAGGADHSNLRLIQDMVQDLRLQERVRIRANFRMDTKLGLLAAADIFISIADNTQETFGLTLLEAQAFGLPVIASRFNGYKDLVREGIDGFLIDSYGCEADPLEEFFIVMDPDLAQLFQAQRVAIDMEQFSARLIYLIQNDSARKTMGTAGRAKVSKEYTSSQMIARYEQRWEELSEASRNIGLLPVQDSVFLSSPAAVFGHYVSETLIPSDLVTSQPCIDFPIPYSEIIQLFPNDSIKRIWSEASQPVSIEALIDKGQLPREQGWFVIMWMLKYNLLRVVR